MTLQVGFWNPAWRLVQVGKLIIGNLTVRTPLCGFGLRTGGGAMINQGVVYIELGSTSYTRAIFGQTNAISVTPLSLLMDLVLRVFGLRTCYKADVVFRTFSGLATICYCHPFTNYRLTLEVFDYTLEGVRFCVNRM